MAQETWVIAVGFREGVADPASARAFRDIKDLGVRGVRSVRAFSAFRVKGDFSAEQIDRACKDLFSDPVSQDFFIHGRESPLRHFSGWVIEVWPKKGVMDPAGLSSAKALETLGMKGAVTTGMIYYISGGFGEKDVAKIAKKALANEMVQEFVGRKVS